MCTCIFEGLLFPTPLQVGLLVRVLEMMSSLPVHVIVFPSSLISANWTFSLCQGFFPALLSLQAGLTVLCIWFLHPLLLQAVMLKVLVKSDV